MTRKNIIFIIILSLSFVFACTIRLHAQDRINYLELKEFFRSYETALKNLAVDPDIDDRPVNLRERPFISLFYHDRVPVFNFLLRDTETQTTLYQFLDDTRTFRSQNYILDGREFVTRRPYFQLENFSIIREKRNGIITVRFQQIITFENYEDGNILEYEDDIYLTLLYTRDSEFKILRLDRVDYAFPDGLGSPALLPVSIEVSASAMHNRIGNQHLSNHSFMESPGADISVLFNYGIAGFGQYNAQLSTGLHYSRLENRIFNNNLNERISIEQDLDGDPFDLLISGNFGHSVNMNYLGLPLQLHNTWFLGDNQLRFSLGIEYLFALGQPGFEPQRDVSLLYEGEYVFSDGGNDYKVVLSDLPRYGFERHTSLSDIYSPRLLNQLVGSLHLNYSIPLSSEVDLRFGPSFHYSFNSLINDQDQGQLIKVNDNHEVSLMAPNLLAFGEERNVWSKFGFSLGVSYQLQRPNVPYRPHIGYREVYRDLSRLRKRDLDARYPPIDVFIVNSFSEMIIGKGFNRNHFAEAVEQILAENVFRRGRDALVYIAFDDSLFIMGDNFDMNAIKDVIYDAAAEGLYSTTNELTNFGNAIIDAGIPMNNRRVDLHMILASPYAYANNDVHVFIERFSRQFLGDNYRFATFSIYTPFLRFHRNRMNERLSDDDGMLFQLHETIMTGPSNPFNFDYHYQFIDLE